jgi:hypothetical protein
MRPRNARRGDKVHEMRAGKHGGQTPAPNQAVHLPNEAASPPASPTVRRPGLRCKIQPWRPKLTMGRALIAYHRLSW